MNFSPTPEQVAIVEAAQNTTDNLLISALAGAAKTSTLVLIAHALKGKSILCLAFNTRIAKEMQERLPGWCEARTLNSLGHRIWADTIGKRLILDDKKLYRLLKAEVEKLEGREKEYAYDIFSDTLRAIEQGKAMGWVPDHHFEQKKPKPLFDNGDFFALLEEEPSELQERLIINVTVKSLEEAFSGTIDYSDQLLLPAVFAPAALFPRYPVVMVDEAQDLSALNHRLLDKLVRGRIIAVGDECQSIYGFRGAHANSMGELKRHFDMTEYRLSISFRCPIAVVKEAQWRAPHMQWWAEAKEGEVKTLVDWSVDELPEQSTVIICRNNAPLFSMAFKLIRNGRYPELVGNDLGKSMLKTMKKFGDESLSQELVIEKINSWRIQKLAKSRNAGKVEDQAACMKIFAEQASTLGGAILYAEKIMAQAGPVKLMTGHKSKGLEFDHVFFLDEDLVGDDQQDLNLRYVIQTRAKKTLTYVYLVNFEGVEDA